jgi:hypothetical protein
VSERVGAATVILLAVLALLPVPGASGVTLYVQRVVVADPGDLRLGDLVQASGELSPEAREALALSVAVMADRVLYIPVSWYRTQLDAAFGPGAILVGTRTLVIPRGSSMDGQAYLADRLADWIQSQRTETKTEITIGSLTARGTPPADGTPVIQATRNTPGSTDVTFSLSGSAGGTVAGRLTLAASPGTGSDAASPAVKSGTAVNVVFKKGLITIEMPGKTLGSASVGDPVSVVTSESQKTFSGQLIDGKAVEVDLP